MEDGATLSEDDKRELLRIARTTLAEHSRHGVVPPGKPHRPALSVPTRVRVTLSDDGARTVGTGETPTAEAPMYRAVQKAAVAAWENAATPKVLHRLHLAIVLLGELGEGRGTFSEAELGRARARSVCD